MTRENIELNPDIAKRYFDMFDGGRALFPSNAFDLQIDALRESGSLSIDALRMALSLRILPTHPCGVEGIVREFEAASYRVVEHIEPISTQTITEADADWSQRRDTFISRIRLRGVADHVQT